MRSWHWKLQSSILLSIGVSASPVFAQPLGQTPSAARQQELIRMVRQDCGSCHGMRLTGGLGPALTQEALADKPLESLVATVHQGRPGTPMAPWSALLTVDEAQWIVKRLVAGFPEEVNRSQ